MFTVGKLLNVVAISINFIGASLMYLANTKIEKNIGYLPSGDDLKDNSEKKTRLFRFGMGLVAIGFLLQIVFTIVF